MPLSVFGAACEAVHANKAEKPVADGVGKFAKGVGNIAEGVVFIAEGVGKQFLPGKGGKT